MNTEHRAYQQYLRMDRFPHIWCPGCGIGAAVGCFAKALHALEMDADKLVVVSGIGCAGRIAGYMNCDSFHTTHGRAIPFATGVKLANPELTVVVISGDGDLFAIGGNHFIHAARRNIDIKVLCINNFMYGMTGGQFGPTTLDGARTSTSPSGCCEPPFNLPYLAQSSGAVYVSRWTTYHFDQLTASMIESIKKRGFSFIEILSPCPTYYFKYNRLKNDESISNYYRNHSRIENGADTKKCAFDDTGNIILGKFVDTQRPTLSDRLKTQGVDHD